MKKLLMLMGNNDKHRQYRLVWFFSVIILVNNLAGMQVSAQQLQSPTVGNAEKSAVMRAEKDAMARAATQTVAVITPQANNPQNVNALSFTITRTTAVPYQSIAPVINGGDGTGILSSAAGDEGTQLVNFPGGMNFTYEGSPCTGFIIHANGYISLRNGLFSPSSLGSSWDNSLVPSNVGGTVDNAKRNVLAPFYDDLDKPSPVIYYKFAGNKATVEWFNSTFFSFTGPQMYFQIVLDGTDNSIAFNYGDMQLYNGTRNTRYAYTCGISGSVVTNPPLPGQLLLQQYENTTAFDYVNGTVPNLGANGLAISPEPRSSIKFTPGTYGGYTPPATTPPANDEPANAIELTSFTAFPNNIAWNNITNTSNLFTTRYATASPQPICAGPVNAKDVWFKFTANNPEMSARVYGSGGFIPRLEVLDSALAPLPAPACVLGTVGLTASAILSNLNVGSVYYVRVYHNQTGNTATATANLTGGAVSSVTITNGGSNYINVTEAYGYVAANANSRITFSGGGGTEAVANGVLSGGAYSSITVRNGGSGYTTAPDVTIESPDHGITGEFGIIIFAKSANDECSTAVALTGIDSVGCNLGSNAVNANTIPATASPEPAVCGNPDDDIWYRFTADKTRASVIVTGNNNYDAVIQVYDGGSAPGNCNSKSSVSCTNNTGTGGVERTIVTTVPGNTYFVRVYHAGTGSAIASGFNLCVSSNYPVCISSPVSPANGDSVCTGQTVLRWRKSADAIGYRVFLDAGSGPATSLVTTKNNNADTSFVTGVLAAGNYTWRVEPFNNSGPAIACTDWTFSRTAVLNEAVTVSGCNRVTYKGTVYTNSTIRRDTLRNQTGCDSLIITATINVTQVVPVTRNLSFKACNEGVLYQSVLYTTSAIVRDTLRSYQGCDSVYIIANISITNITPLTPPGNLLPADSAANINIPVVFSWSFVTDAQTYDLYVWKASDTMPATPSVTGITQISYTYNAAQLQYSTAYKWKVAARFGNCQFPSSVQTFTTRILPDLVVDTIIVPPSGTSESPISINWNVKNKGQGATGSASWNDLLYLSTQPVLGVGTDYYIGTVSNFSALNSGVSYTNSINYTLPQGIQGPHYVIVRTDGFGSVPEVTDTNNARVSVPINIALAPPPDLQVDSLSVAPVTAFSGSSLSVKFNVKNAGTGPTTATNWTDRIYLSNSPTFVQGSAVLLRTVFRNGVLAVNQFYTINTTVTLPLQISGTYYVHILTDAGKQVFEYVSEDNNTATSVPLNIILAPAPNLVVRDVLASVSTVTNNQQVNLQWITDNEGSVTARPSWTEEIYISSDSLFNAGDVFLGSFNRTDSLESLGSSVAQRVIVLPANLAEGRYFFFVKTDAGNNVFESTGESDNISLPSLPVQLLNADLVPQFQRPPVNVTSEQSIDVNLLVRNNSDAGIYSSSWADSIYLSDDNVLSTATDTKLGGAVYNQFLAANSDYNRQVNVKFPVGVSGNKFLIAMTDAGNKVKEKIETNNTVATPVTITLAPWPDLQVTAIAVPAQDTSGTILNFSYTVKNNGAGTVQNVSWSDALFLSPVNNLSGTGAILLGKIPQNRVVSPGDSYTQQASFLIPATLPGGTYYVLVATDSLNNIFENTGENNNRSLSTAIAVSSLPATDLQVTAGQVTTVAVTAGLPANIQWTVQNSGPNPTIIPSWTDAVYLSTNQTIDAADSLLGSFTITGPLAVNGTYTQNRTVLIPNTATGTMYLIVRSDNGSLLNDPARANNIRSLNNAGGGQGISIIVPPPADLVTVSVAAPLSTFNAQPITVVYKVKNTGPGITPASSWKERIYLSTDNQVSAGDIVLGAKDRNGELAPGGEYSDTLTVTIPASVAAGNYVLLVQADADNTVFESSNSNNTGFAPLLVNQQLPSDLVVTDAVVPAAEQIAGSDITISWQLLNAGINTAAGFCREAVYLSVDSLLDVNDNLLGTASFNLSIPSLATVTHQLTAPLSNVAVGNYYVIVRTDLLNNIIEQNENNNTYTANSLLRVNVKELLLNVVKADTLINGRSLNYRIEIPAGLVNETLSVGLRGDSAGNAVNRLYSSLGKIPTAIQFDYSATVPFSANQELLVPSLSQGTYYLTALGSLPSAAKQPVSLLAKIIPFSITAVDAAKGGNTGAVTLRINGAKFNSNTVFRLRSATNGNIPAYQTYFINPTRVFVTFNLLNAKLGMYDVVATQLNGDSTVLPASFEVVQGPGSITGGGNGGGGGGFVCQVTNIGFEDNLQTNLLYPPTARIGRLIEITIQYANTGSVDIPAPTRFLVSATENVPVGFTVSDLDKKLTELLLDCSENGGPPGILRPGASGFFKVYSICFTANLPGKPAPATLDYIIIE